MEDDTEGEGQGQSRKTSLDVKLKNYTKWRKVKNSGTVVSRFLPMKLPYDSGEPSASLICFSTLSFLATTCSLIT
jgi:hypothetical protein